MKQTKESRFSTFNLIEAIKMVKNGNTLKASGEMIYCNWQKSQIKRIVGSMIINNKSKTIPSLKRQRTVILPKGCGSPVINSENETSRQITYNKSCNKLRGMHNTFFVCETDFSFCPHDIDDKIYGFAV